jgi:hypothetical protein
MMTVLEQRFLERLPNILSDLVGEVKKLREEVAKLNAELNEKNEK